MNKKAFAAVAVFFLVISGLIKINVNDIHKDENLKDIVVKYPEHGTIIKFYPDKEIFDSTDFSYSTITDRIMDLAFLNSGITISLNDLRNNKSENFHLYGYH